MQLLDYYIINIFYFLELPLPKDICQDSGSISWFCNSLLSFYLIIAVVIFISFIVSAAKPKLMLKLFPNSIIGFLSCFYFADKTLSELSSPEKFGLDWFIISFYFWCFIIINLFLIALTFKDKKKVLLNSFLAITILFTVLLVFLGRGTYIHITPIIGGLISNLSLSMAALSDLLKIMVFITFLCVIYSLIELSYYWVKKGVLKADNFYQNYKFLGIFVLISLIILASIPLGMIINKYDVADAKSFINEIKKEVDKYYLENGEYPKFVGNLINEQEENPFLLARHEYFTMGIRGTYYFSRPDKYCFVFQNPSKDFGYYSTTSSKEWRYTKITSDFTDAYVRMCDEEYESYEQLLTGHLGLDSEFNVIDKIAYDYNAPVQAEMSKKATQLLHEKILEEGYKNPEIFRFYGNAPEEYKDLYEEERLKRQGN